jgi:hypothetical protein
MRLNRVSVFDRTMLAYERLVAFASAGGAAARRRRASTCERPVSPASVTRPSVEPRTAAKVVARAILDYSWIWC